MVLGMPKEAIRLGSADEVAPLDQVSRRIVEGLWGDSMATAGRTPQRARRRFAGKGIAGMTTVEDILLIKGPDVIVATSTSTVLEAAKLMAEDNVGSVIIRDGDAATGIFTERDLLRRVVAAGEDPSATALEDVMSSPVSASRLGEDIRECAKLFTEMHIRHLAVIEDDGVLVGLIGLTDVQAAHVRNQQVQARVLEPAAGRG